MGKFELVPNVVVAPHYSFSPDTIAQLQTESRDPAPTDRHDISITAQNHTTPGHRDDAHPEHRNNGRLPVGFHGVNVFTVAEMKGRRRLITEPHLNGVISKAEIPRCEYPSRLERRQKLRYARYMLQIDFEAFYDSIPLMEEGLRNKFVFRARDGALYRLRTLPTGARWSVAVGQAVTWTIVDIDTRCVILTMIDNILIAAPAGEETEFVRTVRQIVDRMEVANLCTSPSREELRSWTDSVMLAEATKTTVFLGEEFTWLEGERKVRNSIKTVSKLKLGLVRQPHRTFTCREFASNVSLILYALHTTRLNPASAFNLLRAYRGVYRQV
ncbi:TATE DNA Transposon, partial [Trypanosoma theileri]